MPRRKNAVPQKRITVDSENHEVEVEAVRESAVAAEAPAATAAEPPAAPSLIDRIVERIDAAAAAQPAGATGLVKSVTGGPPLQLEIPPTGLIATIIERIDSQQAAAAAQPAAELAVPPASAAEQPPATESAAAELAVPPAAALPAEARGLGKSVTGGPPGLQDQVGGPPEEKTLLQRIYDWLMT